MLEEYVRRKNKLKIAFSPHVSPITISFPLAKITKDAITILLYDTFYYARTFPRWFSGSFSLFKRIFSNLDIL